MKVTKVYLVLTVVCFLQASFCFAQRDVASLKKMLSEATSDSVRLQAYSLLAKSYRQINKSISKNYIDTVQMLVSDYEKRNQRLLNFHLLFKANSLTTLANIAFEANDLDESIRINLECIKIYEKLEMPGLISVSLTNIGAVFLNLGKHEDAIRYLKKSSVIENEILKTQPDNVHFQVSAADTYINLGGAYAKANRGDSSIYYYEKALALYSLSKNAEGIATSYNGLVNGYRMRKEFDKAISYSQTALKMLKKLGSEKEISFSYLFFSDIYFDMKNYKKALQYSDSVEAICLKNDYVDNLLYIYETKTLIYDSLKDAKNEVIYLKKYNSLKDSLDNVNNGLFIEELKTQYETEKKENQIIKLNKDNKIQELQLEKDAATKTRLMVILISVVIVVLILIWLAFFLAKTIRERKKAYIKLQEKNIEIQKQGEQLNEQSKLISKYQSQMNPHFVFNALNSIQGSVLNDDKENTINRLQLLSQLMRQTLNNSENDTISLETEIQYLETYVEFEKQKFKNSLKFELNYPEDAADILVPPMMIQPFIENSIKHAGLQNLQDPRITLNIVAENDLLKIVVKDNGVGFEINNGSVIKNSHAMKIIQSRLQLLFKDEKESNSHFEIISKPQLERGTEIKIYLPLNYKY